VAQSTAESEYVAANSAARKAEWCKMVYDDLCGGNVGTDQSLPLVLKEDNKACIDLTNNFLVGKNSRHIRVRFHYVRQQVRDGIIMLESIEGSENPADHFTKIVKAPLFAKHTRVFVKDPVIPASGAKITGVEAARAAFAFAAMDWLTKRWAMPGRRRRAKVF